jgi:hypothetical protein
MEGYNEIRQLVENYYDIQKIRIETFSRIVAFIKENEKKIIGALSHNVFETHPEDASHFKNETHKISASQSLSENQSLGASQNDNETQINDASQRECETHVHLANHSRTETYLDDAIKILKGKGKKKYAIFVKKYVLSQGSFETHFQNASHLKNETHKTSASQLVVETHKSNASQGLVETHPIDALSPFIKQIENLIWFHNKLYETEKELYKRLDAWSRNHPLRKKYLNRVKGIGPVLSSGIIAWLDEPIKNAGNVSNIWSYCGLAPGQESQERRKGEKLNYNPKLKSFCWKIWQSFRRFKCFGRKLYDSFREQTKRKHPDWNNAHINNYAGKKVVKLFIASVWEVWRKMNGLPVTKPYPIEFLGHKDIITPEMWMEKRGGEDE